MGVAATEKWIGWWIRGWTPIRQPLHSFNYSPTATNPLVSFIRRNRFEEHDRHHNSA